MVLWVTKSSEASGDTATVSQSNVPPGTYTIKIDGDAGEGVSEVNLKITAFKGIKADSNGNFSYSYNTTAVPPGNFEVKVGGITKEITLRPKEIEEPPLVLPISNFSSNVTEGYAPLNVQFTDLSENTTGWHWDFGDGANSSDQNPLHLYSNAGTYTVNLTASNENSTSSKSATINVTEKPVPILPVANFTANKTEGYAPLTVQFTDLSENADTVAWDFDGDGISDSDERNSVYEFITPGIYTVNLTAANENGTASKSATITVSEKSAPALPVANFTANTTEGTIPHTVKFTDTSTNSPTGWEWNFGDGNTSTEQSPEHTFSGVGIYNVTLVATNDNGSSSVKSMNITVNRVPKSPVANFTANLTVKFTDTSTNSPTRWEWNFGDGTATSTEQNPVHLYSGEGTYHVTLIATNAGGSSYVRSMVITVNRVLTPPVADFTANKTEGITPLTVKFTDTSTNSPTGWEWNFGDGSTSTEQNPEHVFSGEGTYNVTLVATNADGSSNEKSMVITVNRVLTPPVANFVADKTEGTTPLTVKFTDTSTNSPTGWEWNFGDGTQTSIEQNPEHVFSGKGTYNVTLVATNADGSSNEKSMVITVNRALAPPVANFVADKTEGTTPLTVKFTDTSTNSPTGWEWNFGDGSTSIEQNPEHVFSGKGTYNVTLVATNGDGSSNEKSMIITVNRVLTPPVANFTAHQTAPFKVQFNDLSLNETLGRTWTFGDGSTSTDANPIHAYATAGTYIVNLTASNADGTDTARKTIAVTGTPAVPKASFTAVPVFGRAPLTVKFTDNSVNATSIKWDFGDNSATTTESKPSHIYKNTGLYTVKLTATNGSNSNVATKTIYVAR